jgi:hypothetical protein
MNKTSSKKKLPTTVFAAIIVLLAFSAMCASVSAQPPEEDIEQAIVDGLEWLAGQQNLDGSWGNSFQVSKTAFAVLKMEDRAIELGYKTPFDPDYKYSGNIQNGLDYIFGEAELMDTDDDENDAVYWPSDGFHIVYETSIAMMAIAGSTTPDRVVGGLGSPVDGWTYKKVEEYALNYLAWGQNDDGGWRYYANYGDSDNSCTGYAVLGLIYANAPKLKFEITVPDGVTGGLDDWIDYIQCDDDGGSGYTSPCSWENILKTGNLLYEMAFVGDNSETDRAQAAIHYIEVHWNDPDWDPGWKGPYYGQDWPHYQAMYCAMKGFEAMGIESITVGDEEVDWYDEFADAIVNTQNEDGSWNPDYWGDAILATEWALLTLERVVEVPGIQVDVDIKPGSCPNPLNLKSKGVLPVAVLGTEDFDVMTIDPSTIQLTREDVEREVAPIRWSYEDVATPFEGELCDCHDLNGDGILDLTLKFNTPELVETLELSDEAGNTIPLTLTGNLKEEEGGTPIEGEDCIWVLK